MARRATGSIVAEVRFRHDAARHKRRGGRRLMAVTITCDLRAAREGQR